MTATALYRLLLGLLLIGWNQSARAQVLGIGEMLELTAAGAIEFDRVRGLVIATEAVRASLGATVVTADRIEATVSFTDGATTQLTDLVALGRVSVTFAGGRLAADRLDYDLADVLLTATRLNAVGPPVTLQSGEWTLRAGGRVRWWRDERRAVAEGGVDLDRPGEQLRAATLTVRFADGEGIGAVRRADADGGVRYAAGALSISADRGNYDSAIQVINLFGNVQVVEGDTALVGDRARLDLASGSASLASNGGRVRALVPPNVSLSK
jgi:lipopolysaccharide export system protein LptA